MEFIVEEQVKAPLEQVWEAWTNPSVIQQWNAGVFDWFCPQAEVDFHEGGSFYYRIERIDGTETLNFKGTFTKLRLLQLIEFKFLDGRIVQIQFQENEQGTFVKERIQLCPLAPEEKQKLCYQDVMLYLKRIAETSKLLD